MDEELDGAFFKTGLGDGRVGGSVVSSFLIGGSCLIFRFCNEVFGGTGVEGVI